MKDFCEITWLISQNVKWEIPPPAFIEQCKSFDYGNRLTLYRRRNGVLGHLEEGARQTLTTSPSFSSLIRSEHFTHNEDGMSGVLP
jgi:hypothetical protein